MAKYTNEVHYNVTTDFKDTGLNKLNQEILKIQNKLQNLKLDVKDTSSIDKITAKLDKFRDAINQSYNFRLNTTDLNKMNTLLKKEEISVRNLAKDFASLGDQGRIAFMQINNELARFNTQAKNVSAITQKIWNTVGNTVRWGIISTGFQSVLTSLSQATGYIKDLDRSLTDIQLVSNYNVQEMQRFAEQANKAAKALASTTVAYTDASAIFVQQGMNLEKAQKMADMTIKVANITGQTTSEVSEQITSWMNGYQLQAEELQRTLDAVVKVAAVSAANTEEIMTAASRVASTAKTVGVTTDQLVAQMSTIISVTREAPEAVGNAMKTIYSRLSSLKLGETLEDNVTLNSMTATLEKIGVQVLDDNNNLRDMGTIIEELQQKWVDLSEAQQMAASVQLAGRYQLNRFLALMNNQEYYKNMLETAEDATGFLNEKQAIYAQSLAGHLDTLRASIEGIAAVGLDTNDFNEFLETLTKVTDAIGTGIDAIGGFGPLLSAIGPLLLKTFSSNIAESVGRFAGNIEQATLKINNLKQSNELLKVVNEEVLSTFKQQDGSVGKLIDSFKKLNETRLVSGNNLSAKTQEQLNAAFDRGTQILQQYVSSLQKVNELENKQTALINQEVFLDPQGRKLTQSDIEQNLLKNGYLNKKSKVTADGVDYLNEALGITVKQGASFNSIFEKINSNIDNLGPALERARTQTNEYSAAMEAAANAAQQLDRAVKFQNLVNSITKIVGTVGQLAMGFQMLQTSIEKFNDETIEDPIERFNQGIIDLTFGLGMVLPALSGAIEHLIKFRKATVEVEKAQAAAKIAQEILNKVRAGEVITDATDAIIDLARAEKEAATATEVLAAAQKEVLKQKISTFFADAKSVIKDFAKSLVTAFTNLSRFSQVGIIVGAVAAALAGLQIAYENLWSEEAKQKKRQEEITKKIQEQTAAYGEAKDKYKELISTITNYKDAQKALETLTEGSEAWRKKTQEIKDIVDELIEKYPELAGKIEYTSEGTPYIASSALQEQIRKEAKNTYYTGAGVGYAQVGTDNIAAMSSLQGAAIQYGQTIGTNFNDYGGIGTFVKVLLNSPAVLDEIRNYYKNLFGSDFEINSRDEDVNPILNDLGAIPGVTTEELYTSSEDYGEGVYYYFLNPESIDKLSPEQLLLSGRGQYLISTLLEGSNLNLVNQAYEEEYLNRRALLTENNSSYEEKFDALRRGEKVNFTTNKEQKDFIAAIQNAGLESFLDSSYQELISNLQKQYGDYLASEVEDTNIGTLLKRFNENSVRDYDLEGWLNFVNDFGGMQYYLDHEQEILSELKNGHTTANEIINNLDISNWQVKPEDVSKSLVDLVGKDELLLENTKDSILAGYDQLENANDDQLNRIVQLTLLSQEAAQNLAEGYEEAINQFETNDPEGITFFQRNLSNLLGIPLSELSSEVVASLIQNGLINENLWSGDSEALKNARFAILEQLTDLPKDFDITDLYNETQALNSNPEALTDLLTGFFNKNNIVGDTKELILNTLGLADIDGLFVPIETGIANLDIVLNDFTKTLLNANSDISEQQGQLIAANLQERMSSFGFTEEQQAQILSAAPLSAGLTSLNSLQAISDLLATGSWSIEEAIKKVLSDLQSTHWAETQAGLAQKAQELGMTFEEFKAKAQELSGSTEPLREHYEQAAAQIEAQIQADKELEEEVQELRNMEAIKVRQLNSENGINMSDEEINKVLMQLASDQIFGFGEFYSQHLGEALDEVLEAYLESLDSSPWWTTPEKRSAYISSKGYDVNRFEELRNEYMQEHGYNLELASKTAEAILQGEKALTEYEKKQNEEKQKQLDEEQRRINAAQAAQNLSNRYSSEEGFSIEEGLEQDANLQYFRQQMANLLGLTVNDLMAVLDNSELIQLANDEIFKKVITGDQSAIPALMEELDGFGVKVGDLEIPIENLFGFIETQLTDLQLTLIKNNKGVTEDNVAKIEENLRTRMSGFGFTEEQQLQILNAAPLSTGLTNLDNLQIIADLLATGSWSIEEAINKVLSDIQSTHWAETQAGLSQKAQELGMTFEEFKAKAQEISGSIEPLKQDYEQAAAQIEAQIQADKELETKTQELRDMQAAAIRQLNSENGINMSDEEINSVLMQLASDQIIGFGDFYAQHLGEAIDEVLKAYLESLDESPWWSSPEKRNAHISGQGYDTARFEELRNEYMQEHSYSLELASKTAEAILQGEKALAEHEKKIAEEKQKQLDEEQRRINAAQAIENLFGKYSSEQGFSIEEGAERDANLQYFRQQIANLFGLTVEDLMGVLNDSQLIELANSEIFKNVITGDQNSIPALIEKLKEDFNINIDELEIPIETFFGFVETQLTDLQLNLIKANKGITENNVAQVESNLRTRMSGFGFTEEQQNQILNSGYISKGLTSTNNLQDLVDYMTKGSSFEEALKRVIGNIDDLSWALSDAGTAKKAQELGTTFEELQGRAEELAEAEGLTIEAARQRATAEVEQENQAAQEVEKQNEESYKALEAAIKELNPYASDEQIASAIGRLSPEDYSTFSEFYAKQREFGITLNDAVNNFLESLNETPWTFDTDAMHKRISEKGYDTKAFDELLNGYIEQGYVLEQAAIMAEATLQGQKALTEYEKQKAEEKQKQVEEEQRQIAAEQAIQNLSSKYSSEEGFSIKEGLTENTDLQYFREELADLLGLTVDDLEAVLEDGELIELANSEIFKNVITGDHSAIPALIEKLDSFGIKVEDLEIPIARLFGFIEVELTNLQLSLIRNNKGITEDNVAKIESNLRDRMSGFGFTEEQQEQIFNSGYIAQGLTSTNNLQKISDYMANGFSFEEALKQTIEDINDFNWALSNAGTTKKAQELGMTFEELQKQAEELAEAEGLTIEAARQRIAAEKEQQNQIDEETAKKNEEEYEALKTVIKEINPYAKEEEIANAIGKLNPEDYSQFEQFYAEQRKSGVTLNNAVDNFLESLDETPWTFDTDTMHKHISEAGYDTKAFDELLNEYLEQGFILERAAVMAEARLQGEKYKTEREKQIAEEQQKQFDQEQLQIDAIEAGQELAKQYQSEEGFNLTDSLEDVSKLQSFRKSLADILGLTIEDLDNALDQSELIQIANHEVFKGVMQGDASLIPQLLNLLAGFGLKTSGLEISLNDLFTLIGQKIEETEEIVTRSLQEIITNFLQIINNLKEGSTISEENYQALVEQLGEGTVDQYFTKMIDGTYMLIGAADDFKQSAMNVARIQVGQQLEEAINKERENYGDNDYLGFGSYASGDIKTFTELEFSTAETLEQLQYFKKITEELGVSQEITFNAYNENLLRLGMNYENAADEVKAFRNAQTDEQRAAAQRDLEGSIAIGQDQSLKELNLNPTEIDDYADHLQDLAALEEDVYLGADKLADSLEEDEEAAAMLSKQLTRMNRAVETLNKNWDNWADMLQNSSKGSGEYFDAMKSAKKAMSDLLDISEDFISSDLVDSLANNADNMELMKQAAEGDGDAIDQLRQLALEDIVVHISEQNDIDPNLLLTDISAIQEMIPDIEVGATVDDSALIDALNEMIVNAGLTKDQVNALLGSMGFDANFESEQEPITQEIPIYQTVHKIVARGTETMSGTTPDGKATTYTIPTWTEETTTQVVDTEPAVGYSTAFGLSTSAPGEGGGTPKISSVTRKANGSANNRSAFNYGGNSTGGKGGGGGGKGGGGGGKANQADPVEKEKDRYQKVNEQIAKTVAEYDQLTEAQERLLGPELAMNLADQNEKLEEQIDLQKEKLRIQREEQRDRQAELSQYGIIFNPDGTIANYSEVWDAQTAKLEAARQAYNGTSTDDEEAKEAWEAAQKYFDTFEQGITKYDSLLEGIYDTNAEIQSLHNAMDDLSKSIVENAYDAIKSLQSLNDTMQEVSLNLTDPLGNNIWAQLDSASKGMAEFFQMDEQQANAAYGALFDKAQKLIKEAQSETEKQALIDYMTKILEDLDSGATGYLDMWNNLSQGLLKEYSDLIEGGSNSSNLSGGSLKELMQTAFDNGASLLNDLIDKVQNLHSAIMDGIQEIGEGIEKRREDFENIGDELEHQLEVAEMLYGEESYRQQEQIIRAQLRNSENQISMASQTIDLYQSMLGEMIEGTEEWEEVHSQLVDAQKEYNDLIKTAIEYSQKLYENIINAQLDNWIRDTLGNDMDWVQEEWELVQRNAEQYLDDVEKAYNIQKLQNSYEDLLNHSTQLDIQQRITDQMSQQLGYLRGKAQLSKYDVDYANAQLEILQRQIALEEAQRNKNQMRLTRDSQGNYSYVYTASRESMNSAAGDLLDAQYNAYNLSKQTVISSQSDALSALSDFYDSAQSIATNYNLSEEERSARLQELWDLNREYLQGCAEQLGVSFTNIQNDFYGMVDALEEVNEGNLTEWEQQLRNGVIDMTTVIGEILSDSLFNWLNNFEDFNLETGSVIQTMIDDWSEYDDHLSDISESAQSNISDITSTIFECVDASEQLKNSQVDFFNLLEDQAGVVTGYLNTMQGYVDTISNLEGEMKVYKDTIDQLKAILSQNYISYELNGEKIVNNKPAATSTKGKGSGSNNNQGKNSGASNSNSSNKGTNITGELIEGIAGAIWTWGDAGWGNQPVRQANLQSKFGIEQGDSIFSQVQALFNSGYGYSYDPPHWGSEGYDYYKNYYMSRFKSGGYTGSWPGGAGKLGILDSKELVLNAKDTENMLAAIRFVREIVSSIQGASVSTGLNPLTHQASSFGNTIDQNVTITANFPNATNENEIKDAILGLVDQSVQYSSRTKPTGKVI